MSKNLEISLLLDFYGDVLGENQRDIIEDYYNADLSLAEIAQDKGISRQGVRDSIKRSEAQLLDLEEKLKLYKKFNTVEKKLGEISTCVNEIVEKTQNNDIKILANKIASIAGELTE